MATCSSHDMSSFQCSHRLCYRTLVKKCTDENNFSSFKCRFFSPNDFGLSPLSVRSNPSSVTITSVNGSEFRTVCFYNVSLSRSSHCSTLRLYHMDDHPEEEYIDNLNVTHPCRSSNECKDYLQIYYGYGEGNQQNLKLCREELATLDITLHNVTSFRALFWSDNTPSSGSSFHVRAECSD